MKRPVNKFPILLLAIAAAVAVLMSVMTYVSATSAVLPDLAGIIASPLPRRLRLHHPDRPGLGGLSH